MQVTARLNGKEQHRNGWRLFGVATPYLLIFPAFLLLTVFIFYPLAKTVQISFFEWNLVSPKRTYVGFTNYIDFIGAPDFLALLWQTGMYLSLATIGNFLLPTGLALLTLQVGKREMDLYQSLLFVPTVVAISIGTLIWLWFYVPSGSGLFNSLAGLVGLRHRSWLNDPVTALPAVSLVANWKYLGFNYLIALAGLSAIRKDLLEAARVDGAEGWPLLRFIIVPLFGPSALFLFVTTLLQSLENVFVPIEILTVGGPAGMSNNLMYAVYQDAFKFFRAGRAAADSIVLIGVFAILILVQFSLFERAVHYDN